MLPTLLHPYFRRLVGLLVLFLFARPATAQWVSQNSALSTSSGIANVSIVDASTVWASGYNTSNPFAAYNGYARTTNGGSTWTAGSIAAAAGYALTTSSAASSTVAWAAANGITGGGYLYYTADGGSTWTRQLANGFPAASSGYLNRVLAFSTTQVVAAGDPLSTGGPFEIYTSSNAGGTWTAAATPVRQAGETGITRTVVTLAGSTAAATARPVWLGTSTGRVLRSTDSGATWSGAATGLSLVTALAFCSPTTGLAVDDSNPGTIAYTTNGGASWSTRAPGSGFYPTGLAGIPGLPNAFVSTGNSNNSSSATRGSSYSLDGGVTWTALDAGVGHTAVSFLSGTVGWSGGVVNSTTGGGMFKGSLPASALAAAPASLLRGITLYPNPAAHQVALRVPAAAGPGQLHATVRNALGQVVLRQTFFLPGSETEIPLSLAGLASGPYTVHVQVGETVATQRLLVQ